MSFNIDIAIFIGFLIINLVVGLYYAGGIKNIREYAIGNRNFSTGTIAATLIATWISGSAFLTDISEVYKDGLFYIVPGMLGDLFSWIIICYFLAPRMGEFLGSLSIADAMGNLYGSKIRLITSLSSTFNCIGKVAVQFKVSATILQLFFGVSSFYATLASSIIVIIYSTFGGIRAVTFTDIIQFFTFGTIIPIIALIIWGTFGDPYIVFDTVSTNPLFDYHQLFDTHNPKFWGAFTLAIYFIIPTINPAIFQRISMARDTTQVSQSFSIATIIRFFISILFFWIGILLLANNPNLEPNNLFAYIIDNYTYIGFKGLVAAGVMAMVMSTADSYINAATVTFSYDLRESLGIKWPEKYNLIVAYICASSFGILAFVLAFYMKGLLSLFLMINSFYLPIVTVPFLLAIVGFRSTPKAVLIGMAAGLFMVIVWRNYLMDTGVDSVIPGALANLIFFLGSHYLLRQQGGWIGIKDKKPLEDIRRNRKKKINNIISTIKSFNLITFCQKNTPKHEVIYSFFGAFCIISIFSTMYSLPITIREQHEVILSYIYHFVLISSTIFLTYPAWPATFRNEKFIAIFWNIGIFSILVFIAGLLVAISNFAQFQLMIFILNLVVISMLINWQAALLLIFVGVLASVQFLKWYIGFENLPSDIGSLQFKIMYSLLMISSVLIAFIKPKQELQELTKQQAIHLGERIDFQEKELQQALALKGEFIRNISHEYHAPMTGISSMAEVLAESYYKLNDQQRLASIDTILKSSARLEVFDANISSLAKLSKPNYELQLEPIDLSNLLHARLETCRKLYEGNHEDREFITNIEEEIQINGDNYYLTQLLDNLIINAISYCKKGKITITLKQNQDRVEFSISDEGIGIPPEELEDIFAEFTVSSKTRSLAGNRGIGLALCKRVAEVHRGSIKAESNGKTGSTINVALPILLLP